MGEKEILEEFNKYKSPAISEQPPIVWERGSGVYVEDVEGKKYLDFSSVVVVTSTGHCPPPVVEAVKEQAEKLICCYDYPTVKRAELQRRLAELVPTDLKGDAINKVNLFAGGTEAVEAALKVARRYTRRHEIISNHGAFHGKTLLAMAISRVPGLIGSAFKSNFGPVPTGCLGTAYGHCYRCEFGKEYPDCDMLCVRDIERVYRVDSTGQVAAFIVEPVQGAAGNYPPPVEYIRMTKEFCEENDILFIDDEIMTGFGRTGKLFAIEHFGVKPDIVVFGKAISAGVPLSGIVARESILDTMRVGEQTSTHGGHPLGCAAALANLDYMFKQKVIENAERIGEYLLKRFNEMKEEHRLIGDVRGKGLMIGIELVKNRKTKEPARNELKMVHRKCVEKGLFFLPAGYMFGSVIRVTPPLIITKDEAEKGVGIIEEAIAETERSL